MSLDYSTTHIPPPKRKHKAEGGVERRLTEAAVMFAVADYLLAEPGNGTVTIHPDGEHAKRFKIAEWLMQQGFRKVEARGGTLYGGVYVREDKTLERVQFKSKHSLSF